MVAVIIVLLGLLIFGLFFASLFYHYITWFWMVGSVVPSAIGWSFGVTLVVYVIIIQLLQSRIIAVLAAVLSAMTTAWWIIEYKIDWFVFEHLYGKSFIGSDRLVEPIYSYWCAYGLCLFAALVGLFTVGHLTQTKKESKVSSLLQGLFKKTVLIFYIAFSRRGGGRVRGLLILVIGILLWLGGTLGDHFYFMISNYWVDTSGIVKGFTVGPGDLYELRLSGKISYPNAFPYKKIDPYGLDRPLKEFYQELPSETWDHWVQTGVGEDWPLGSLVIKVSHPSNPASISQYYSIYDLKKDVVGMPPLFGREQILLQVDQESKGNSQISFFVNTTDRHLPDGKFTVYYRPIDRVEEQGLSRLSFWFVLQLVSLLLVLGGLIQIVVDRKKEPKVLGEELHPIDQPPIPTTDKKKNIMKNDLSGSNLPTALSPAEIGRQLQYFSDDVPSLQKYVSGLIIRFEESIEIKVIETQIRKAQVNTKLIDSACEYLESLRKAERLSGEEELKDTDLAIRLQKKKGELNALKKEPTAQDIEKILKGILPTPIYNRIQMGVLLDEKRKAYIESNRNYIRSLRGKIEEWHQNGFDVGEAFQKARDNNLISESEYLDLLELQALVNEAIDELWRDLNQAQHKEPDSKLSGAEERALQEQKEEDIQQKLRKHREDNAPTENLTRCALESVWKEDWKEGRDPVEYLPVFRRHEEYEQKLRETG